MTELAESGTQVTVTCDPAVKVPPRGAVMASGEFWALTYEASNEAAVARMLKKRMLMG